MQSDYGEIALYQTEDGKTSLEVQLQEDSVWLTQAQMVELFEKTKQNVSLHIRNIFKEGELVEGSVVKESLTTARDGKEYKTKYYNLDVVISVGYRIKSLRGTQFRIWATTILREHLIRGYTVYERRLAEKGLVEMEQAVALLSHTLQNHQLVDDEGRAVLDVISNYAKSWTLLLQYDEQQLSVPGHSHKVEQALDHQQVQEAIGVLKTALMKKEEASDLFGLERNEQLQGILGSINQTFDGQELYPSVAEKAAHLLYFIIKDHPFSDGNKRIGSFLFVLFLKNNGALKESGINENGLVALALLIAESDPQQKELMIRLILNFVTR
jgi:prophage maintenance system killer protein